MWKLVVFVDSTLSESQTGACEVRLIWTFLQCNWENACKSQLLPVTCYKIVHNLMDSLLECCSAETSCRQVVITLRLECCWAETSWRQVTIILRLECCWAETFISIKVCQQEIESLINNCMSDWHTFSSITQVFPHQLMIDLLHRVHL